MDSTWQRPGLRSALLYAVAAGILGTVVSLVSRVELTRRNVPSRNLRAPSDLAALWLGLQSCVYLITTTIHHTSKLTSQHQQPHNLPFYEGRTGRHRLQSTSDE